MAIPLTTLMLIRDLKAAFTEEEKRPIRVKLADIRKEADSEDERAAIDEALLQDSVSPE